MKEEKSLLLQFFGESPEMQIVDFLMENYLFDYMKKDMECVCQRFNMEPATFIKRFIIDPEIANHYEEKGEF